MPAVSGVGRSGNVDIDGVLQGTKWASGNLTYSFPTSISQYNYSRNGFEAFNATQQAAVKSILASYASVANLTFTEVKETTSTHGTIRFGEEDDAGTAFAYYPSTNDQGGDVWLNHKDYNAPAKGNYAYMTLVHESGHTLGLDHGQDGRDALPYDHDTIEYSVMTYRSYVGSGTGAYTVSQGSYAAGPMLADIAALQYMYGANYNSNAGNNTYKWNPSTGELTIDGASQGKSSTNTVFQTVWDGGG
ncbi:MAG: matrixin family metalloprotease, partial [Devosia sp.]